MEPFNRIRHLPRRGFSLVATIAILVLLALISVALLSLTATTVRSARNDEAMHTARTNARMALILALGELQKHAGPDQRVTGRADLADRESENPHWSAVWDSRPQAPAPHWLVSGNGDGKLELRTKGDVPLVNSHDHPVKVKGVAVNRGSRPAGRYAWWVADEGIKARVDLQPTALEPVHNYERLVRSGVAPTTRPDKIADDLKKLAPAREFDKSRLLTPGTIAIAGEGRELPAKYLHALTTGGFGLPVNVVEGGMKTDLSIIFDSSQERSGLFRSHFGSDPGVTETSAGNARKYFLLHELSENGRLPAGPNWGILHSYATQFRHLRGQSCDVVGVKPMPQTDIRTNDWPPYRNDTEGPWRTDTQHVNSSISPVLAYLQMGFRMKSRETVRTNPRTGRQEDAFQMQLEMKPVVGLWNPYNVRISRAAYRFDWALYPYLRLGIDTPDGQHLRPRVWMREHWMSGNGPGNTPETSQSRWFQLVTDPIDLEPGEFRLFSVTTSTAMRNVNKLESKWNEEGAFTFDLVTSRFDAGPNAGRKIIVPTGSVAWYGDLFLEDSQHPETARNFPGGFEEGASASWITVKTGGEVIHRISDLWVTPREGQKTRHAVPEQVISEWTRTGSTSPKIPVEQLARSPWHIGTWAWFARTSTEADDPQDLRGWIDTNARYVSNNPLWDGSRVNQAGLYDGWFFNTFMLGGSYPATYDGGPPGRGKIAEGSVGDESPQTPGGPRFQGYGGPSTTALNGQTHVAIFDVPRAPLVSLAQFQHAQIARYGFEPSFAIGNSYANPRIPLHQVLVRNFADVPDFTMLDLSYRLNEELWDDYFFSTVGVDYVRGRAPFERSLPLDDLRHGKRLLPNPRYRLLVRPDDETLDKIVKQAGSEAPRSIASRIAIEGAFNVNSTSREAWKAILSSLADYEFPLVSGNGRTVSWEKNGEVRLPRFGHVLDPDGWESPHGVAAPSFWRGFRSITAPELNALAGEIVEEVRTRGPFRSLARFVNRDPESERLISQRKGALQAALDATVNADLAAVGGTVTKPQGDFSDAFDQESEAAGNAGFVLQSDLLQSLGPLLQVRSDYFRIRTMGEATDPDGQVTARAYCEATVQRIPDYLESTDPPETSLDNLKNERNKRFGRRFRLLSFRWLSRDEL